jgi:hypothetical protein
MKRRVQGLVVAGLLTLAFATSTHAREVSRWDFTVYVGDKRVGNHIFEVTDVEGVTQVQSEADFKYRVLLIPAYRYKHSAAERWNGDCLLGLDSRTNANGKRISISGKKTDGGFTVVRDEAPAQLPECVMSFAYWNPSFLEQPRLLNPQTGEYVDVSVERVGDEILDVRGVPVPATRFRLRAYEMDLTLWYSSDDEWLKLESVAKGGHVIRYELT